MKVLKIVLVVVGLILVIAGLYQAFVPQEIVDIGPLEVDAKEGFTGQTIAMVALGVAALVAGAYLKKR